jgi:hypothetical protein
MTVGTLGDATSAPAAKGAKARLGEELPLFCEKCGYLLHGLAPVRCEQCQILHFQCPECGHRQVINTLRPAAQHALGRVSAIWLAGVTFFKINYFGWLLFAWVAMGHEWHYLYARWTSFWPDDNNAFDVVFAFTAFALPFAGAARLLLLRWRSSVKLGIILAALVVAAIATGALLRVYDNYGNVHNAALMVLLAPGLLTICCLTGVSVVLGAVLAWPVWKAMAHLFLPSRMAAAMLEWQQSQSERVADLARS